ncbi:MAG: hypothetical protein AAFO62_05715 [Pseudomonadota bacterium]
MRGRQSWRRRLPRAALILGIAVFAVAPAAIPRAFTTQAHAKALTAADKAAVKSRVDAFTAAFNAREFEKIADFLPPRVLKLISQKSNVPMEQLLTSMRNVMRQAMDKVQFKSFGLDVATAETRQGSGGEPFMLVPTQTVITDPNGRTVQSDSKTLALKDGGTWYLMRVQLQQVPLITEAYPYLKGTTFERGTVKVLE